MAEIMYWEAIRRAHDEAASGCGRGILLMRTFMDSVKFNSRAPPRAQATATS